MHSSHHTPEKDDAPGPEQASGSPEHHARQIDGVVLTARGNYERTLRTGNRGPTVSPSRINKADMAEWLAAAQTANPPQIPSSSTDPYADLWKITENGDGRVVQLTPKALRLANGEDL